MEDLKVGDRVTVVKPMLRSQEYCIGLTGVISEDRGKEHLFRYRLKFDTYVDFLPGGNVWAKSELELIKEEKKGMDFTKDMLKTGQLVQTREGQWFVVMKDHGCTNPTYDMIIDSTGGHLSLNKYNNDLTYTGCYADCFEIVKVTTFKYLGDIFGSIKAKSPEELSGFKVIWQRESEEVQRQKELVSQLKKQLADATATLEKMESEA